jgi:uncharacterized protein (DUF433 family)
MRDEETRYFDVTSTHIAQTASKFGNKPYIVNTRVRVQDVYISFEYIGKSPDEIAHDHQLTLAQVFAALTFCYDHRDYIERAIEHDRQQGRQTQQSNHPSQNQRRRLNG